MILFFISLRATINLSILYEKQVDKTVAETYRIYLDQLYKNISKLTELKGVKITLEEVLPYNTYKEKEEYEQLSRYAGGNNLKDRIAKLDSKYILLALTTNSDIEVDDYNIITPCKILYLVNLDSNRNFDRDVLTNLLYGSLDMLSIFFGFDVPNVLDMNDVTGKSKFIKELLKSNIETKIKDCEEKSETKNPTLAEDNNLVDRFEKLMNLLDSKKSSLLDDNKTNRKEDDELEPKKELSIDHKKDDIEMEKDTNDKIDKKIELKTNKKDEKIDIPEKNAIVSKADNNVKRANETKPILINTTPLKKNRHDDDEDSTKDLLKDVIMELKNLRLDLKEKDDEDKYFRRRPNRGNTKRYYDDYKNETIVNLPLSDISKTEFQPFKFGEKKTPSINELKLVK